MDLDLKHIYLKHLEGEWEHSKGTKLVLHGLRAEYPRDMPIEPRIQEALDKLYTSMDSLIKALGILVSFGRSLVVVLKKNETLKRPGYWNHKLTEGCYEELGCTVKAALNLWIEFLAETDPLMEIAHPETYKRRMEKRRTDTKLWRRVEDLKQLLRCQDGSHGGQRMKLADVLAMRSEMENRPYDYAAARSLPPSPMAEDPIAESHSSSSASTLGGDSPTPTLGGDSPTPTLVGDSPTPTLGDGDIKMDYCFAGLQ